MINIAKYFLLAIVAFTCGVTIADTPIEDNEYVIFYHNDVLGSPVAVSDGKGRVLWYENTDPYGEGLGRNASDGITSVGNPVVESADSRIGYTGHEKDNTSGLTYMKARHFDPVLGRFYSNDPVGIKSDDSMSFNRYSYANNNPYVYTDPDGRDAININYVGYRVNTGLGFRAPLGHGGVVLVDETSGHTEYYEYGRYSPAGKGIVGAGLPAKKGNVRRVSIPDVEIGDDGRATPDSLKNLYSYLKSHVGKGAKVDAEYEDDADFKKMKDYVDSVANDPNREPYNLFNCNCFGFSDDVIQSGRSGDGDFFGTIRDFFSSDGEDE